jgi:hypothetical protein
MHKTIRIRFGFSGSDNRKSKIKNLKSVGLVAIVAAFLGLWDVAQAQ